MRALILPFGIAIGYVITVPVVLRGLGLPHYHGWWFDGFGLLFLHILFGLLFMIARIMEGRLVPWLRYRAPSAIAGGVIFVLFLTAFASWKHAFWRWGWFVWDPVFATWDRWIHLGRYPHEWFAGIARRDLLISFCGRLYFAWLLVIPVTLSCVLWTASPRRCRQFLLTFVGVWVVIGSILGPMMGSGGPIYYSRLAPGVDPYGNMVDDIRGTHSEKVKEWLWDATNTAAFIPATGISAMPSVHIGQAMLILC